MGLKLLSSLSENDLLPKNLSRMSVSEENVSLHKFKDICILGNADLVQEIFCQFFAIPISSNIIG